MTDAAKTAGKPWVKLDAAYYEDDDLMAAVEISEDPLTELAWVRLLCFARRKESDGILTSRQTKLALAGIPDPNKHLAAFASVGLLQLTDQGNDPVNDNLIRNYGVWQQTGQELAAERAKWAEKKARQRGFLPTPSSAMSPGDSPGESPESPREKRVSERQSESESERKINSYSSADAAEGAPAVDVSTGFDAPGSRPDVDRLCEHLAASAVTVPGFSKKKNVGKAWRTDMRLLLDDAEIDTSEDEIVRVIDWTHRDAFWGKNIQSPSSLRKQFERLRSDALGLAKPATTGAASARQDDFAARKAAALQQKLADRAAAAAASTTAHLRAVPAMKELS